MKHALTTASRAVGTALILLAGWTVATVAAGAADRHDVEVPAARVPESGVIEFVTDRRVPTGQPMDWVAAGRFDRDGRLDLVVGAPGIWEIGVLLQTPSGEFARRDVPVGGRAGAVAVAVADITGDGLDDLALALPADSSIALLLADGDGGFSVERRYRIGRPPKDLVFADLDGDRDLDLACVSFEDKTVTVLRNLARRRMEPHPEFESWTVERLGLYADLIAAGDFNGDGTTDLATGGSRPSVLPNLGDGTFGPAIEGHSDYPIFSLTPTPADYDGDGDLDLAGACEAQAFILYNDGRGVMKGGRDISNSSGYYGRIASADLDNDGDMDLLHSTSKTHTEGNAQNRVATILNNAGKLKYHHSTVTGPWPMGVIACDVNGDGFADAVTVNRGADGEAQGPPSLSILTNRGNGHFGGVAEYAFPTFNYEGTPYDLTPLERRGRAAPHAVDLLFHSSRGTDVMRGDGIGGFGRPEFLMPQSVSAARDLTGDGVSDLVTLVGNGVYRTWIGDQDGGFAPVEDFAPGGGWSFVQDGKDRLPDILVGSILPAILENLGHGRFGPRRELPPSPDLRNLWRMVARDLDGDGVDELIAIARPDTLVELARTPSGEYRRVRSTRVFPDSITPERLTYYVPVWIGIHPNPRDGGWDFAVSYNFTEGGSRQLSVLRRHVNGLYEPTDYHMFFAGAWSSRVMEDFDGDGLGDVAITAGDNTGRDVGYIQIFRNVGGGNLVPEPRVHTSASLGPIVAADVSGDGRMDAVAYGRDYDKAYVFLGRGGPLPEGAGTPPPKATKPVRGDRRALPTMLTSGEPGRGSHRLSFSMPRAGPARLELFDLSGRRVLSRELGWLAAGEHAAEPPDVGALASGIYWLRAGELGSGMVRKIVLAR